MNRPANQLPSLQPHSLQNNLKLWCDPKHADIITDSYITNSINQRDSNLINTHAQILKTGTRRRVIRVNATKGHLVIKLFPFTKIKEKLKYKKYGLAEIYNNIRARKLGIPAPHYYAYFELRHFGLVSMNGCIMNFLDQHTSLEDICNSEKDALHLAIPVLTKLFHKGVNHIDISPANIFFTDDKTDFSIIDWQYCSFYTPNDPLQLVVQTAHFLRGIKTELNQNLQSEWLEQLCQSSNPDISRQSFLTAISNLQNSKLSIKDRLALDYDRTALFGN